MTEAAHVKLDPVRESCYFRIVSKMSPEYQTVEHRLELRRDMKSISIDTCKRLANILGQE